jgi:hypothetical protein
MRRANAILEEEERGRYPAGKARALTVAENPAKKARE